MFSFCCCHWFVTSWRHCFWWKHVGVIADGLVKIAYCRGPSLMSAWSDLTSWVKSVAHKWLLWKPCGPFCNWSEKSVFLTLKFLDSILEVCAWSQTKFNVCFYHMNCGYQSKHFHLRKRIGFLTRYDRSYAALCY